jgi:signal transduction histidine kinase
MNRPTLLGQLSKTHVAVIVGTCALLVAISVVGSAVVLRQHQDRIIEAIALEVANGVDVEAREAKTSLAEGAEEYFGETRLVGFRFELLGKDGRLIAWDGKLPGWDPASYDLPVDARVASPRLKPESARYGRFRGCARWCGDEFVLRVVTTDVLSRPEIQWLGVILLVSLPLSALAGIAIGRAAIRRHLAPLGALEAAAAAASADPGMELSIEANTRELATLQDALNGLLGRVGDALARERRFSQEASHELRTPLAALRTRIERLAEDRTLEAGHRERAAAALSEVDALDRLIDALLLLARSESAPLPQTPVNLCDLARDVARRQAASDGAASPAPEVEAPDEILVRGSEELLTRAVANLVENARKFAGPKARVRIRVSQNGAKATIAVADDGPGIASRNREHVFDRFFRAAESRSSVEGVGLGLAVVRTIALRHQGQIEARQSDLGGAELSIAIPRIVP